MHNADVKNVIKDKPLVLSLVLNGTFTILEFLVGFFIGSLTLMSDAGHNFGHTANLTISLFGNRLSRLEANEEHSFGFRRTTTLAAFFNAIILFLLAFYVFYEAIHRLTEPHFVPPGVPIIMVALLGIVVNGSIVFLLEKERNDLNIKSVFVSAIVDAIGLIGTAFGGVLIIFTKQPIIDPLISIFIGILIIYAAWGIISNAIHVLMEGVPEDIDPIKIRKLILKTPLVRSIDHLHIWTLSSGHIAMSCHIFLQNCNLQTSTRVVKEIKKELGKEFYIEHATIEVDLE